METITRSIITLTLVAFVFAPTSSAGIVILRPIGPGETAVAFPDWPEGVQDLINDPLRSYAWDVWGTELPDDIHYFEMDVRNVADADHLIHKLSAIKAPIVRIVLDPATQPRGPMATSVFRYETGAMFTIGNQSAVDAWVSREAWRRRPSTGPADWTGLESGVSSSRTISPAQLSLSTTQPSNAPTLSEISGAFSLGAKSSLFSAMNRLVAQPPTLTLYLGSGVIHLDRLKVPPGVRVDVVSDPWGVPGSGWEYKPSEKDLALMKSIEDFVAVHKAHQADAESRLSRHSSGFHLRVNKILHSLVERCRPIP